MAVCGHKALFNCAVEFIVVVIRPVPVTDAVLTSSDVPENDRVEFDLGTTFNINDEVMITSTGVHSIFISLINGNIGNQPEDDDPISPANWARVSATNRFAMFSDQINDQTEQANSIEVVLTPSALINGMSFFGLDATEVQIVMNDPTEGEVYNRTFNLVESSGVNDWYAWYFEPLLRQTTLGVLDIPPFVSASLTVTIRNIGFVAKCGLLTMGSQRKLGDTDFGTTVGILDFSRKERDTFGNAIVTQRNFAKRVGYTVTVDTAFVATIQQTLADLRTTSATWIGSELHPSTITYGFYKDFDIIISNNTKSLLTISVEGLV